MKNILVLNPNSSPAVTDRMRRGCDGLDLHPEHRVSFHELADGPPVIETQRHVEAVAVPVCDFLAAHPAEAYVIGCFSDPGLYLAREEIEAPVLGIAECAYREAAALGRRFGIVSISAISVGGEPVPDLLVVGTLRKPREWESTAVPELSQQAAVVCEQILRKYPADACI